MRGARRWLGVLATVAVGGAGLAVAAGGGWVPGGASGGGASWGAGGGLVPGGAAGAGVRRLPARPAIVSVNPCTDAILVEVADPRQVLALSDYSRDPAQTSMDVAVARRFGVTGGTVEEIVALRPDVVLGGGFMPPATRAALARLGIRVVDVGVAGDLPAAIAQVRTVAALAGARARGEALVARMERAVAEAGAARGDGAGDGARPGGDAARAGGGAARPGDDGARGAVDAAPRGGASPVALIRESDGMIAGSGTLIVDLARRVGLGDGAARLGLHQAAMPGLEPILARPPVVMIVVTRGGAGWSGERVLAGARLGGMRLARLDPALVWCGGPTVIRAAARLAAIRREVMTPAIRRDTVTPAIRRSVMPPVIGRRARVGALPGAIPDRPRRAGAATAMAADERPGHGRGALISRMARAGAGAAAARGRGAVAVMGWAGVARARGAVLVQSGRQGGDGVLGRAVARSVAAAAGGGHRVVLPDVGGQRWAGAAAGRGDWRAAAGDGGGCVPSAGVDRGPRTAATDVPWRVASRWRAMGMALPRPNGQRDAIGAPLAGAAGAGSMAAGAGGARGVGAVAARRMAMGAAIGQGAMGAQGAGTAAAAGGSGTMAMAPDDGRGAGRGVAGRGGGG